MDRDTRILEGTEGDSGSFAEEHFGDHHYTNHALRGA